MKTTLLFPVVAAWVGIAGSVFAQGTSIGTPGTTQGSTQEAGASGGNPTSEEAAASGSSASPNALRREGPARQAGSTGSAVAGNPACDGLAGLDREKCVRNSRGATDSSGTASGVGGSPDRVGPGSTGMGR